jgi:hypothetical protein
MRRRPLSARGSGCDRTDVSSRLVTHCQSLWSDAIDSLVSRPRATVSSVTSVDIKPESRAARVARIASPL